MVFITATSRICNHAQMAGQMPLNTHAHMPISKIPMTLVKAVAWAGPRMRATISWCRGTRFNSLQIKPLTNQTDAMKKVRAILSKRPKLRMGNGNKYSTFIL